MARHRTISVSVPVPLLKALDALVAKNFSTRSRLTQEAIRVYVAANLPAPTRYESAVRPGLFFWAERTGSHQRNETGAIGWAVWAQAHGAPMMPYNEAWYSDEAAAVAVAKKASEDPLTGA